MFRSVKAAAVFLGALMLGVCLGATASPSRAYADAAPGVTAPVAMGAAAAVPIDPKKKMPGDACKSSDECQTRHTCTKVGDKNVCQAPPSPRLPPHAVT